VKPPRKKAAWLVLAAMGRKKKFIDKKNATSYRLIHRDEHSDDEAGDYELVTSHDLEQRHKEAAAAARARHPMSAMFLDEDDYVQNDQQRTEILESGLPDDGYNYLLHLRDPGTRTRLTITGTSREKATVTEELINITEDLGLEGVNCCTAELCAALTDHLNLGWSLCVALPAQTILLSRLTPAQCIN
jgi:hypothetical protein